MTTLRSLLLFAAAAVAEIGGAWLIWQGVREHRGLLWIGAGIAALGVYGFVATFQPDGRMARTALASKTSCTATRRTPCASSRVNIVRSAASLRA